MGRGRCQTEFAIFSPDSRNARQNIREGAKIVQQGPKPRFVNESSFVCFEEMQLGGLLVLQTRFARVGVFQAAAAAGRGIMGRPLLPAATQGQTRLSLLGLSNIPRRTICPGIPNRRQGSKDWKLVSQIWRSCIQTKVGGMGRCSRFAIQGQRVETFPFPTPATPKISGPLRFFKN